MVIVEIKNLQLNWDSLDDKYDYLESLYPMLLDLSDQLEVDRIQFVGEQKTYH